MKNNFSLYFHCKFVLAFRTYENKTEFRVMWVTNNRKKRYENNKKLQRFYNSPAALKKDYFSDICLPDRWFPYFTPLDSVIRTRCGDKDDKLKIFDQFWLSARLQLGILRLRSRVAFHSLVKVNLKLKQFLSVEDLPSWPDLYCYLESMYWSFFILLV